MPFATISMVVSIAPVALDTLEQAHFVKVSLVIGINTELQTKRVLIMRLAELTQLLIQTCIF